MDKLIRFFRNVSFLVFLGVSLYAYAFLPARVFVFVDEGERFMADKGVFFYTALGVFFFVNILIMMVDFYVTKAGASSKPATIWLASLAAVLNLFLTLSVAAVFAANADLGFSGDRLFYAGLILIVMWFMAFLFLFRKAGTRARNED